jgi:hypothetical protein
MSSIGADLLGTQEMPFQLTPDEIERIVVWFTVSYRIQAIYETITGAS